MTLVMVYEMIAHSLLFGLVMCCRWQNVLRLVETSYRDHCAYHKEADTLRAWIVCTSETVESLTSGLDSLSKEELELILGKLHVMIVKNMLDIHSYIHTWAHTCHAWKPNWRCRSVNFPWIAFVNEVLELAEFNFRSSPCDDLID